jgi:hypothetical protein
MNFGECSGLHAGQPRRKNQAPTATSRQTNQRSFHW